MIEFCRWDKGHHPQVWRSILLTQHSFELSIFDKMEETAQKILHEFRILVNLEQVAEILSLAQQDIYQLAGNPRAFYRIFRCHPDLQGRDWNGVLD